LLCIFCSREDGGVPVTWRIFFNWSMPEQDGQGGGRDTQRQTVETVSSKIVTVNDQ
jgi:hypothetical protein